MYLKKIEIQGFKSFADKITIALGKGVTSIVGPNGSGKSNISDAVRWVLGEQSVKSLRGSRMDDVIFSGTEHRKPSGFAEVTLVIDNADGGLSVPYSDVSVTRRVFRSGESEYLINKNQCRLKDVNELFFDTGVGREGYTIIGQGKVEEILNNKPEERRGIFEEAAGISKYKVRKHEAERKLDATSQNLVRIRDILGELETQLAILEEQAAVARKYLQLRDELKEIEVAGYVSSIGKHEAAAAKIGESLTTAKNEYDKQTGALNEIEASMGRVQKRAAAIDESQAELNRAVLGIESRHSEISNLINLNNEKVVRAKADIDRVRAEISRVGDRKSGHDAELKANRKKLTYLDAELSRFEGFLNGIKREYETVLSELDESDRAIEEKKQTAAAALDRFYDEKNKLSGMYAEKEHYKKASSAIEKNISAVTIEIDAGRLTAEELSEKQNGLLAKENALHAKLKDLSLRRVESGAALDEKKRAAGALLTEMNAMRSKLKILTDMESNYEGFFSSVKRVLAECKRSPDFGRGINGAVASLINVPKELETAISMALGAAQQNIITDDEPAAARAIAFLKRVSGGRATFLPITAVRGRTLDAKVREKLQTYRGFTGIAAELIGYDSVYLKVINELLGTTVVVDTLDNGLQIVAKHRFLFRVVTLDGDIITAGGAITGGSVEARGSGILSRRREIPELESGIERLDKDISAKEREIAKQDSELNALTRDISAAEREQNEYRVENAALAQKIEHLNDTLRNGAGKRDLYKLELEESAKGAAELDKALELLSASVDGLSAGINNMQSEIDAYSEKNREEQRRRDAILADMSAYSVSVASVSEARKAVVESIDRLENELADNDRSIASRETAILRFGCDIEKYTLETEALNAELDKADQEKNGIYLRIEGAAAEKASLNAESGNLVEEASRTNGLLAGISREINRLETREARIKTELEHCKNRLWEDYELTYHNALALLPNAGATDNPDDGLAADGYSNADGVLNGDGDESGEEALGWNDGQGAGEEAQSADGGQKAGESEARRLNPPLMGEAAAKRSAKLREEMRGLGPVNVLSIDECSQTKQRYELMEAQRLDLEEAGEKLRRIITEMSQIMRKNFEEQFELINRNFDVVFKELFSGGRARLTLSEGRDILDAGVEIEIQLPGKRMQNMMLYSGGERALTAIALIFAMLMLKPVPFCLLDEIESALDEANVERFAAYIKKYSEETQFIMVTHRKGTMEGSNVLYGVTMRERGVSGVVSLRLSDAS